MKRSIARVVLGLVLVGCADAEPSPAGSAEPAQDVLEVHCDGETTEAVTPSVQARVDGVHVSVINTSGAEIGVSTETHGDGAAPGETAFVFPILPGVGRIRCLPFTEDNAMENGDWASFEVLPPTGWVSPQLDCPGGSMYQGVADFVEGARGVDDPLADAERSFRLEGVAREAGYRTAEQRTIVNFVDGAPKESFVYIADGHEGWLQSESAGCSG